MLGLISVFGADVSIGNPSSIQRGRPPSRTLELRCPKVRNMNRARGAEKMP